MYNYIYNIKYDYTFMRSSNIWVNRHCLGNPIVFYPGWAFVVWKVLGVQYLNAPPDGGATWGRVPQINIRSARAVVRGKTCARESGVVVVRVAGARLCALIGCGLWMTSTRSNDATPPWVRGRACSSSPKTKLFWRMQESAWGDWL